MNGLLKHSNLSFASSRPPSIISLPTTTSSDTVEGIGTLSGRAVYAVGEAALRGLESLAIRRKLRVTNSAFPHGNVVATKNMESIYGDVLELSRPGLYRLQVRKQALRVLMIQIGTRQTNLLLQSLVKWPTVEIALFLSEVMACMPAEWLPPSTILSDMYMELKQAYMSCLNTGTYQGEYHPASPVIDFVTKLAQINYQAVLDSGFLDMLLCMYVCNFSSGETVVLFPQQLTIKTDSDHSAMLEACTAALEMLCQQADALAVVLAHPVCTLWPKSRALLDLFGRRSKKERYLQWREMGTDVVARRLVALPELLQLHMTKRKSDFAQLTDVCVDIVEFSRETVYGSSVAHDALALIHNCIELRGTHWDALHKALTDISPTDSQDIFRRLILRISPAYGDQLHGVALAGSLGQLSGQPKASNDSPIPRLPSFKWAQYVEPAKSPTKPDIVESAQPSPQQPNLKSFKLSLDDPTWRVLPAALKKYRINSDNWQNYAMFICYRSTGNRIERCLSYDEKPLLLFQKLKDAKKNPVFMLKHINDVRSPIAVAQQKHAARKASTLDGHSSGLANGKLSAGSVSGKEPDLGPAANSSAGAMNGLSEKSRNMGGSADTGDGGAGPVIGEIPVPIVELSYAVAIYPYMAEIDDEFDVVVGDTFVILSRARGWWVVQRDPSGSGILETDTSKQAWVPAGCLLETNVPVASAIAQANGAKALNGSLLPPASPSAAKTPILPLNIISTSFPGIALMDYKKKGDEELDLVKDDSLREFKTFHHWSYVVKEEGGNRGWVPSWFISKVANATGETPPMPSTTHASNVLASSSMTVDAEASDQPQVSPISSAFPP